MARLLDGTRVFGTLYVDTALILAGTTMNGATGSGSILLSNSPTITGHPTIEGVTSTGATGTGNFVFATSPSLTTPNIGVATATSVNKLTITAPATSATLTLANGSTLATSGAFSTTLTATATTALTLPTSGYVISTTTNMAANPVTGTPSSSNFLRGDGTWSNGGIVTTVGFTGGLITVATATSTPALTVAGTSGGVVYFSSTSTWASSALLASSAVMLGGGAGAAPVTTTTGTGVVTAIGVAVNTSGGFVTQSGVLATSSLLVGGGSAGAITSTSTGTNVVAALGIAVNTTNGFLRLTSGLGAGVVAALAVDTGTTGGMYLVGGALGTPSTLNLSNASNLPISGINSLGTGVGTALAAAVTGSGGIVLATGPTLTLPVIDNIKIGYTTTATAAGTTTLTSSSTFRQYFTGTTTQDILLPPTNTLALGMVYQITNESTGIVTVKTDTGTNTVLAQPPGTTVEYVVMIITGSTSASWDYNYVGANTQSVNSGTAGRLAYYASTGSSLSNTSSISINTGQLTLGVASTSNGAVILQNAGHAYSVTISTSSSQSASYNFVLPPDGGTSGYVLQSNGDGTTAWISASLGGGGGGSGASVSVSSTAPATPTVGDLWWNPSLQLLYIYESSGTGWIATSAASQDWGLVTELITSYDDYGSI